MANKIDYFSYGNATNGDNFCSALETSISNLIEDDKTNDVIVFPSKDGWASMRSESYRMTTDNMEMVLPFPIYKIKKVLIKPVKTTLGGLDWDKFLYIEDLDTTEVLDPSKLMPIEYVDITDLVITEEEWKSLKRCGKEDRGYVEGIYKDNTFYWSNGGAKILCAGTVYKIGFFDESPTWMRLLISAFYKRGGNYVHESAINSEGKVNLTLSTYAKVFDVDTDPRKWLFRIEYVPMQSSIKLRAHKSESTKVDYVQPFNQRAETNAVELFGRSMHLAAQKTGVRCVCVAKNYKKLADIPPLGALVWHNGKQYRLVVNQYKMTNTVFIQVMHTLSENWTNKSKHVSVDQKYRNWNIPMEMLWRNLYWEEFCHVSFDAPNPDETIYKTRLNLNKQVAQCFSKSFAEDYLPITSFFWRFNADDNEIAMPKACVLPCNAMVFGNSLLFTASFQDNYSAGLQRSLDNAEYCEEVPYCKAKGELNIATVILAGAVDNPNDSIYPQAYYKKEDGTADNTANYLYFNETFAIYKDRSEALKFTYQIHFIQDNPSIILGEALFRKNTLIKRSVVRKHNIYFCNRYVREGENTITNATLYTDKDGEANILSYLGALTTSDGVYCTKIGLPAEAKTAFESGGYVAWAITDETGALYLACNDNTKRHVYFWLSDKK